MGRCVETEAPLVVLLAVWRVGVPIMKLDGKSRIIESVQSAFGRRKEMRRGMA
jgi:hypothetical protein